MEATLEWRFEVFLSSCHDSRVKEQPATLKLNEQDHGRDVETRVGREIELCLPENPTAGFRWRIVQTGEPVCSPPQDGFEPGKKTGQPGIHFWRFKIVAEGAAKIELAYHRAWESGAPARRTFFLNVNGRKRA